jgi:hypothetical protein
MGRGEKRVRQLGLTIHAGEQLAGRNPFGLLDNVEVALKLGTDRIGHGVILGMTADQLDTLGFFKKFESEGEKSKAHFEARRQEILGRLKALGVVVELNLTSNQDVSNITLDVHAAAALKDAGVRLSVNTDDEALLFTTVANELHRFAQVKGVGFQEVVAAGLEAFASRLAAFDLGKAAQELKGGWKAAIDSLPDDTRREIIEYVAKRFLGPAAVKAALARGGDQEVVLRALLHDVLRFTFE